MTNPAKRSPLGSLNSFLAKSALIAGAALCALPGVSALAHGRVQPFTVVETGKSYNTIQEAVSAIGDARGTIRIANGTHRQCAVQERGVITYLAAEAGKAVLAGKACEGKAGLVLRGIGAEVRGITFRDYQVPDGNGAGIRLERGQLNIAYARFLDSQQGILTANDTSSQIYIIRSTFSGLGTCENSAGCAHSIYIGDYGKLTVLESRFERGRGGHYVKARSGHVVIENNSFDDAAGVQTNYMIDLPSGAIGSIANNWFVRGQSKENYSAFIAVGAEQGIYNSDGLRIVNNEARFVPGVRRNSAFVADWTGARVQMANNRLAAGLTKYERR